MIYVCNPATDMHDDFYMWSCIVVMLHYSCIGAVSYTSSSSRFGRGVDTNLTNFRCYGSESHLPNCLHSMTSYCSRDYTAGVLCYGDVVAGVWIYLQSTTLSHR